MSDELGETLTMIARNARKQHRTDREAIVGVIVKAAFPSWPDLSSGNPMGIELAHAGARYYMHRAMQWGNEVAEAVGSGSIPIPQGFETDAEELSRKRRLEAWVARGKSAESFGAVTSMHFSIRQWSLPIGGSISADVATLADWEKARDVFLANANGNLRKSRICTAAINLLKKHGAPNLSDIEKKGDREFSSLKTAMKRNPTR